MAEKPLNPEEGASSDAEDDGGGDVGGAEAFESLLEMLKGLGMSALVPTEKPEQLLSELTVQG